MKIPLLLCASLLALALPAAAYDTGCGNPAQNNPDPEDCETPESGGEPKSGVGTNPVNPHRASLNRSVTDLETFGAAPITFTRYYTSRPRDYTKPRWELGTATTWQHNWQYEVRESNQSDFGLPKLIVRYPEGREYYFSATDATGATRVSDANLGDRLYKTGAATWVLRKPSGWEYEFRKVGSGSNYQYLLDYVRNGTGWRWTLTYQTVAGAQRLYRITNNYGRYLQITRVAGADNYYQITAVTANDGRSVSYGYSTWTPSSETVLTSVTYPGSLQAAYTWVGADGLTSGPPLLATANDPMQSGAGSRMRWTYNYTASYFTPPFGITNGTVLEERNLVTDQVVVRFPLGSGNYPQVLEGNGTELLRKYEFGLIKQMADGEGRTTTYTRDSGGAGYITQIAAPDTGTTTFTRDFAGRVLTRTNALGGVRTYTYNANGFLLTAQDELGRTTTHTRDASNRITRTDHPDLTYETFTYTGTGLLKTHRFRNGFTETRNYDSWGNLATRVDVAGHTWTYTSTSSGLIASIKDPRNFTTSYEYDWRGNLTKTTHPDTTFRTATYNAHGKVLTQTDELGQTTTFTYSPYLQVATVTDPLTRTTSYEYGREPGCGTCGYLPTLSKITLPSGKITEMHYDRSGKLLSRVEGAGTAEAATTAFTYGTNGLPLTTTDPRGKVTSFTHDLLGRRLTVTDPLTHTTTTTYDAVGNVLTTTRANTSAFTRTYDAMNRQLTETNPNNETTTYTYHPDGSLASLQDARTHTYTFTVDALSRRTRMTYPGGSYENWTFDGAGNMTLYRARNAATMTCTFDNRNRDTLCDWSDATPDVTRTYDAVGRVLTLTNSAVALAYAYDAAGQLTSETYTFSGALGTKTVGYTYDDDGNRATLTYPDGFVTGYGYTARNQVSSVTAGGPPPLATFTYDLAGNRLTKTLENGTITSYSHDDAGRLTSVAHEDPSLNGDPVFASISYAYDAINRRTSGDDADSYTYDAADQIKTVDYGAGNYVSYFYDAVGNRTKVEDDFNGNATYAAANALNQYSTFGTMGVVTSDANGNVNALQANTPNGLPTWLFTYDSANRLTGNGGGPPSFTFTFGYDARNRAVVRTIAGVTTYQIYDGWNLIAEYDGTNALLARYVHGPRMDEILVKVDATGSRYYHENGLGSTVALTDETAAVVERYRYDVFGQPTFLNPSGTVIPATTQGNRFLFTGREWFVRLGLYDYRNRVYSPKLGRFLQTDPIRFSAGDVNLYRYVANDPINSVDPLGLEGCTYICGRIMTLYPLFICNLIGDDCSCQCPQIVFVEVYGGKYRVFFKATFDCPGTLPQA